jgi:hypothetical protein
MSNYVNRFKRVLVEADDPDVSDKKAMQATLDQGTETTDFDVKDVPPADAQAAPTMSAIQKQMYDQLKQWIDKIDEFKNYLNAPDAESVVSKLNAAEADTLFDKISTSETKKIARVAAELGSFSEDLKGYLATANDPKYRYV